MLSIGKSRIERRDGTARLCADITVGGRGVTVWFAVDAAQEKCLAVGRADPFVMALLPGAMRGGHEIVCDDPMSERLRYQMREQLIPALCAAAGPYRPIRISAQTTREAYPNMGAVGTGFSGGVDSLYTVMTHGPDSEYPLTHLAVFNAGVFEGETYRENFRRASQAAARFAAECGFRTIFVDTNFHEALPERFLDVYSFRNLACALALQGLFSVYLLSSGHDAANFCMDLRNTASYDLLTVACAGTETMAVHLSGVPAKRREKLAALADWEPSWRWLHPCVFGWAGVKNCGRCKKCVRDMTTLFALGVLDRYGEVFDTQEYRRHMAARMGFVLAERDNHLYGETLALLEERHVPIPPAAYVYEKQFRRALCRADGGEGQKP